MRHPKADGNRMHNPRIEGGRGMTNLEMAYKKTKLHSVVKEMRKFKFRLDLAHEGIDINTKPTQAAKYIKKKAKNASLEDMRKRWRQKSLHGKYPLITDNADVHRAMTHQWISSSSLKGETECFTLAAQNQSISTPAYQLSILNKSTFPNWRLFTERDTDRGKSRSYSISMPSIVKHRVSRKT